MDDFIGYFDTTQVGFAWSGHLPHKIEARRAEMNDALIFDVLLFVGGIRKSETFYPPRSVDGLFGLLSAIDKSSYDALKKECLVYYLLKWHQDGREDRFRDDRSIPPQFTLLADAYWYLDAGVNVSRAVSILCDARLNRDYASKILHAITLSPNPARNIIKYIRSAQPPLTEPDDVDLYVLALAETSFHEAWQFQRTFPEADMTRSRLIKKLFEWSLKVADPRARPLSILLGMPFTRFEEFLIDDYAMKPPKSLDPPDVAILRDFICVRLIQAGRYIDAIKMDHRFSSSTPTESKAHSQDRKKMIQDLYAVLPLAERSILDTEIGSLTFDKPVALGHRNSFGPTVAANLLPEAVVQHDENNIDLSMSWEEVSRPLNTGVFTNGAMTPPPHSVLRDVQSPIIPISERSAALRFGGAPLSLAKSSNPSPKAAVLSGTPNAVQQSGHRLSFPLSTPASELSNSILSMSTSSVASARLGGLNVPSSSGVNGARLVFPPPSSSTSVPKVTTGQSLSGLTALETAPKSKPQFTSAMRRENAFYHPPPAKVTLSALDKWPGDQSVTERESGAVSPTKLKEDRMELDRIHERDDEQKQKRPARRTKKRSEGERDEDAMVVEEETDHRGEFGFSVFRSGAASPPSVFSSDREAREKAQGTTVSSRRVPPGAFHWDEEEDEEVLPPRKARQRQQEGPPTTTISVAATPSRRSTRLIKSALAPSKASASTSSSTATAAKAGSTTRSTKTKTKQLKESQLRRSIPGSLMDEDEDGEEEGGPSRRTVGGGARRAGTDDDEEEEDRDLVAPLRLHGVASPTTRSTRASGSGAGGSARSRARSSLSSDDGFGDGVQTRRRSSRLSTVSGGVSPEPPSSTVPKKVGGATRGKKRTAAASTASSTATGSERLTRKKR